LALKYHKKLQDIYTKVKEFFYLSARSTDAYTLTYGKKISMKLNDFENKNIDFRQLTFFSKSITVSNVLK
jgi:hypothetical protein